MIDTPNSFTKVRTISIKPYNKVSIKDITDKNKTSDLQIKGPDQNNEKKENKPASDYEDNHHPDPLASATLASALPIKRGRGRPRKHPIDIKNVISDVCFLFFKDIFIKSPVSPFTTSRHFEIIKLIKKEII